MLAANDPNGMRTVSLRPSVLYGERDNVITPLSMMLLRKGMTRRQIGDNTNAMSITYAGNGADAHILAASRLLSNPEGVAGEAFFVNDGEPMSYWTFNRKIWSLAGDATPLDEVKVISASSAYWLAWFFELIAWITGGKPKLTGAMVYFATSQRSFNCTKARTVLGYEPKVTSDEGLRRSVKVCLPFSLLLEMFQRADPTEQSFLENEKR